MGLRNGHFTFVNILSLSQNHCNLRLLSFVVHCSITVDEVLEFCKIPCSIVLTLITFNLVAVLLFATDWRCHLSIISSECLLLGLTDHKDLKCLSQMWLRQQSTFHSVIVSVGVGVTQEPACSAQTLSYSDLWWHMSVLQPAVRV